MKNIIRKIKSFAVGLATSSALLFALPNAKAGVVTLLATGNTNIVANATTNLFAGVLIAPNQNAKELAVSFSCQMALTNTAAITLVIDTAILTATNVYGFNDGGHWQTSVQTISATLLNNTNIFVTNFVITPTSASGGMPFYRFSVGNGSATSGNYVTNLFLTTDSKTGL